LLKEIRSLIRLAGPLVISQAGLMVMILVDTYMVGKLGSVSLAGLGLGNTLFVTVATLNAGFIFGLDGLFAREHSRGGTAASAPYLAGAAILSVGVSIVSTVALSCAGWFLPAWGVAPEVADVTSHYLMTLSWCFTPGLLFLLARQYLAALGIVRNNVTVIVAGNVLNVISNLILIPKLGVAGAGISTTLTRVLMVAMLVPDLRRALAGASFRPKMQGLMKAGGPTSLQMVARGGVFSLLGVWVARMGVIPMAAHAIVLIIANFMAMLPIGLGTAVAIRTGQALGHGKEAEARQAWQAGLWLGGGFMGGLALILWLGSDFIVAPFASEIAVHDLARDVILWVAIFQITDAFQYVVVGALRAYHEYQAVLWGTLVGLWGVGLVVGQWLTPRFGLAGIWMGVCAGLGVLFSIVALTLRRKSSLPVRAAELARSHSK